MAVTNKRNEEIKNEKKYDVEPFDITQLLPPCPPYNPPETVIKLPGIGMQPAVRLVPIKGIY